VEGSLSIKTVAATDAQAISSVAVADAPLKMSVQDLSVHYRTFRAVADVNLLVYNQKITAIIGSIA
jgi:ABC-type uncharacterized transport system ATPase subunit